MLLNDKLAFILSAVIKVPATRAESTVPDKVSVLDVTEVIDRAPMPCPEITIPGSTSTAVVTISALDPTTAASAVVKVT